MKSILASVASVLLLIVFYAFSMPTPQATSGHIFLETDPGFEVPKDVQQILDNSCLPCHGPDGSGKAKMKFNWEKMPEMKSSKQVSKLSKVVDKVQANKMPPSKFINKHPDAKLSDEQKKLLVDWAEDTAEKLVGGE